MALSFEDLERLRPYWKPRCKQAITKYLLYHNGGNPASLAANQLAWVKDNLDNIDQIAEEMTYFMMSESGFIDNGTGGLTDANVTSRVESVMASNFLPAAE